MSDMVERLNAALEGRYAIERELGEGGMATVYLAEDLKHHRKVALKVLKPELAAVVGAERFLAEITTTANLTHPHILPLHDSGEADSFLFYVMPHIEGESLRKRIDREKQLGVDDSVAITQKVAGALDYAHQNGVVHRDIKPGNILLSEQGEPLVADFGIALAVAHAGAGRITETGLSLGTPHYMSPEQATGDRDVDPRSDFYALGCVLYEMLAGQPPFSATTAQAVLVKILTADAPSITSERRTVPPHVGHALAKALEKLPADRFTSAAEFAAALGDESFTYQARRSGTVPARRAEVPASGDSERITRPWLKDRRLILALGAAVFFALLYGMEVSSGARAAPARVPFRTGLTGFEVRAALNSGSRLAISPDGSAIAVASFVDGLSKIFVRRSDQREFREIEGTDDAYHPTFSPDGQWLAFQQAGMIQRVQLSGGPMLPVTEGTFPHWGLDEALVFRGPNGIYQVSPSGSDPVLILEGALGLSRPQLLPDGRAVIFQGQVERDTRLMLVEIGSGEVVDLGVAGLNPRYIPTGHLVYGHESQTLMAVPFDLDTHRVTGEPATILPEVLVYGGGATQFAVSETGTAVYGLPGSSGGRDVELVITEVNGAATVLPLGVDSYSSPRFAPDGVRIAYSLIGELRVYDRDSGANQPLGTGGDSFWPMWSRDGRYVYFVSEREGTLGQDVFRRLANGSGDAEHLVRRERDQIGLSTSLDGTQLLIGEFTADREGDLLIMSEGQDGPIFTDYLRADWDEVMGTISPEGDRVAYVSNESGVPEVYVRSFPEAEVQMKVSEGGGTEPVWAPDGTAIYYLNGGRVMRASVTTSGFGEPATLFEGNWASVVGSGVTFLTNWDVHPDGTSFVFVRNPGAETGDTGPGPPIVPIEVVTNWFEELRERMGGN